jgi:hypothetical protein
MDKRLAKLIADYQHAVQAAAALIVQSGIPRPSSNVEWAANGIPHAGQLKGRESWRMAACSK